MTAATATTETTFSIPETVTIPSSVAIEAVALLDAYAAVVADFTEEADADPLFQLAADATEPLYIGLKGGSKKDAADNTVFAATLERQGVLEEQLRSLVDHNDAFSIAKLKRDVAEVKARLEFSRA